MFEDSYKIRVSARAVIFHEGCVLLNQFGDGVYYNFPGGGIEARENAWMAVVREVREETGLNVAAGKFVFALEYEPWSADHVYGDGHHISFFFCCEPLHGTALSAPAIPDVNPHDTSIVSRPVWVALAKLPEINLVPRVNQNLLRYFETGAFEPAFFLDKGEVIP